MRILVTSDGIDTLERAARYAALLAEPANAHLTLLAVTDRQVAPSATSDQLEEIRAFLATETGRPVEAKLRRGNVVDEIVSEIKSHGYALVVLGTHARRRLSHLRPKQAAQRILRQTRVPLLVASPARRGLERILICTSGHEPETRVVKMGGQLAALTGARVTILHVMSQIPMAAEADLGDLRRDADELIEHRSREGRYLQQALETLAELGLPDGTYRVMVRHGLIVDEILRESEEGDYDLIVVGTLHVPRDESWNELREFLRENMAERVLGEAKRPVLIVPSGEQGRRDGEQAAAFTRTDR